MVFVRERLIGSDGESRLRARVYAQSRGRDLETLEQRGAMRPLSQAKASPSDLVVP